MILAAAGEDAALVFIEIGAVALGLAVLARLAGRLGITAIPFYLVAGLAVGEGGIAPLDVSAEFISLTAEIGVLLLLLVLGLEYTADELRHGLRGGLMPGGVDAAVNFTPGLGAGLLLGWDLTTAVLLGGVCWISSSGVVAKVLSDLDRLGNRETPAVLNVLVIEDLAMAAYLPVVAALVAGRDLADTAATVSIALAAVVLVLVVAAVVVAVALIVAKLADRAIARRLELPPEALTRYRVLRRSVVAAIVALGVLGWILLLSRWFQRYMWGRTLHRLQPFRAIDWLYRAFVKS